MCVGADTRCWRLFIYFVCGVGCLRTIVNTVEPLITDTVINGHLQ
jgi:hypothetical protein